jgi:hypothetical protein
MNTKTKIGIIICDRYRTCAGGKCLRAMKNKEGAFSIYTDTEDAHLFEDMGKPCLGTIDRAYPGG